MNHSVSAYISAMLSLVGVPRCFGVAAASDFAYLRRVQLGLSALPPAELSAKEAECRATTQARQSHLRWKTVASLGWVLSAAAVAGYLFVFPVVAPQSLSWQAKFAIASVVCFAWATLGRLGWTERSYKGSTIFEEIDAFAFWALYWLGTLCGVAAVANAAG